MESTWVVWSTATSEKSARNVAKRFMQRLRREWHDLAFAPYPKSGGWQITFQITLTGTTWNDQVVEVIGLGQRVGYGWILSGDVHSMLDGWSNKPAVTGVTAIQWQLWPPNAQQ